MNNIKTYEHPIGKEGNGITLSHIKNDWYMFVVSDHYDDNHIGLFVHKDDIREMVSFLNKFLTDETNL